MKKQKQAMTLLEIMIVIFIIGIVASVMGFNMRGTLDKGKAFKTEQGINKIYEICQLRLSQGATVESIISEPHVELRKSGMVKNPKKFLVDGWGDKYIFSKLRAGSDVKIFSKKYAKYLDKKGVTPDYPWDEDSDD